MPRTTAQAKVTRDKRIVADRARGLRWATIAERHGLSERQCREVWTQERTARREAESENTEGIIADTLDSMDAIIEEYALLAETTNNDAVRLGAIKARMQAVERRVGVLQATGLLPPTAEALRFELDARAAGERLVAVLNHHGVEQAVRNDIVAAMREVTWRPAFAASSSNGSGS